MKRQALVTGSNGFVGTYLKSYLEHQEWEVHTFNLANGQDIRNYETIRNELAYIRPDAIFHLAAQAAPAESFANPQRALEVNTVGTTNILEAVRQLGLKTKIHLVSSSEVYGHGDTTRWNFMNPRSPYAVSKAAMDQMGQVYMSTYDMPIVITRAFNHTGPGRGEEYAESSFAKQIAEYEIGRRKYIVHGDLSYTRNYTDVRDIVRAYVMAIDLKPGVYNICSEVNVKMETVMHLLSGMSKDGAVPSELREYLLRPNDFSFETPACENFQKLTGWKAEIPFNQTLRDLLDYWRKRV